MADSVIQDVVAASMQVMSESSQDHNQSTETLLQATNALFRRRERSELTPKRKQKRGRKHGEQTMIRFFFLDRTEYQTVPSLSKKKIIQSKGLGEKELKLNRTMTRLALEDHLVSSFPALRHGFKLMKSGRDKKLDGPLNFEDVGQLKTLVRKGKVYILPPRTILTVPEFDEQEDTPLAETERTAVLSEVNHMPSSRNSDSGCDFQGEPAYPWDPDHSTVYQALESPTISFRVRPHRDAAELSRVRVQEWVQDIEAPIPGTSTCSTASDRLELPQNTTSATPTRAATPQYLQTPELDSSVEGTCPVCQNKFPTEVLELHAATCGVREQDEDRPTDVLKSNPDEALEDTYDTFTSKWDISVIRRNFLKTAMEQIEDSVEEDWAKRVRIRFIGEQGVDEGGLSREFFTMLFRESPVFEDSLFSVDADLLSRHHYQLMGKVTALALLSGHPGPKCLERHLVDFILTGKTPDMGTIPLQVIKRKDVLHAIKQIQDISEENEDEVNLELADILELANFRRRINTRNKTEVVEAVKAHFCFYKCLPALLQYMEGLKINGVLEVLKQFEEAAKYLVSSVSTSASEVMDVYIPTYSSSDSEKADEEVVMYNMHQFLKNVERGRVTSQHMDLYQETETTVTVKVQQVLESLTGSQHVTSKMMGTINFDHSSVALSTVNTCLPSINFSNIKSIISYANMEAHMLNIMFGTYGFGIV